MYYHPHRNRLWLLSLLIDWDWKSSRRSAGLVRCLIKGCSQRRIIILFPKGSFSQHAHQQVIEHLHHRVMCHLTGLKVTKYSTNITCRRKMCARLLTGPVQVAKVNWWVSSSVVFVCSVSVFLGKASSLGTLTGELCVTSLTAKVHESRRYSHHHSLPNYIQEKYTKTSAGRPLFQSYSCFYVP